MRGVRSVRRLLSTENRESKEYKIVLGVPSKLCTVYERSKRWWSWGKEQYSRYDAKWRYDGKFVLKTAAIYGVTCSMIGGYVYGKKLRVYPYMTKDDISHCRMEHIRAGMLIGTGIGALIGVLGPYTVWIIVPTLVYNSMYKIVDKLVPKAQSQQPPPRPQCNERFEYD